MKVGRVGRIALAAVVSVVVGAFAATSALAAPAGLDGSFGSGGLVQLAPPLPAGLHVADYPPMDAVFARDGSAYATEAVSTCEFEYSVGPCERSSVIFHYRKNGSFDGSFGGGSGSIGFPDPAPPRVATDAKGRALVVGRAGPEARKLSRLLPSGRPDPTFGRGGTVGLPKIDGLIQFVLPAGRGRTLVIGTEALPGAPTPIARVVLIRLLPDGRRDPGFGEGGRVRYGLAFPFEDTRVAVDRRGAILILGGLCCEGLRPLYRISAKGQLDRRFNAAARGALNRLGDGQGGPTAIVPRPNGGVDVLGVRGNLLSNPTGATGFDLRLTPAGQLDKRFGERGLRSLPFPVTAASPGSGGATMALGEVGETITAHRLLAGGAADPAFGGGTGVQIPQQGIHASIQALAGGRAGVVGEGFRPCVNRTCVSAPYLARFIEASPPQSAGKEGGRS